MRRAWGSIGLLTLFGCGDDAGHGGARREAEKPTTPSWAKVSPQQAADAARLAIPVAFEISLGLRFVLIPAGRFSMGSPPSEAGRAEDEGLHEVVLSKPFYLSVDEVTDDQFARGSGGALPQRPVGKDRPVTCAYDMAQDFIRILSRTSSGSPRSSSPGPDGGHRFRLPTEAEWEYACRGGSTTAYAFGDAVSAGQANFGGDPSSDDDAFARRIRDVGSYPPNAWGLRDMHGNASEWCEDWYGAYPSGATTDPGGPPTGSARVLRGGRWDSPASAARAASRESMDPQHFRRGVGFRVAADVAAR